MLRKITLLLIMILVPSMVLAGTTQRFIDVRSAAMGNAGVASAKGMDILYSNPALLSENKGNLTFISMQMNVNQDSLDKGSDLSKAMDESDDTEQTDMLKKLKPLKVFTGLNVGLPGFIGSAPPLINKVSDKFGLGVFSHSQIYAKFVDTVDGEKVKVRGVGDAAIIGAIHREFEYGVIPFDFNAGLGIKYVAQARPYDIVKGLATIQTDGVNGDYTMGTGIGFDIGFVTEVEEGTLGLILRDVGSTSLKGTKYIKNTVTDQTEESDFTDTIPMSATIGYAKEISLDVPVPVVKGLLKEVQVAADFDIISEDSSFFKRLHAGLEKGVMKDMIKLRLGLNQGYITYGIALDMAFFHLAYASYSEEMSSEVGFDEARYHMLKAGLYF